MGRWCSVVLLGGMLCTVLVSCQTSQESLDTSLKYRADKQEERLTALEGNVRSLLLQVKDLEQDNYISKKTIAQLKNDTQSLQEQSLSDRRNIEVLRRGLRSGVWEDTSAMAVPNPQFLPDMNQVGRALESSPHLPLASPTVSAEGLLAEAEILVQQGKSKEALERLSQWQKDFPNHEDDGGKVHLLMAEAWLQQKEYDKVFVSLRAFYVQHLADKDHLPKAKYLEALAHEGIGQKTTASRLYQEVVQLAPEGKWGQEARKHLVSLQDIPKDG